MNLFFEIAFEVFVTAFFVCFLAKLLSPSRTTKNHGFDCKRKDTHDCKFMSEEKDCDFEAEEKSGFVPKLVKVGKSGNIIYCDFAHDDQELLLNEGGSKLANKIEEVEIVEFDDKGVEESCGKIVDLPEKDGDDESFPVIDQCLEKLIDEIRHGFDEGGIDLDLIKDEVGSDKNEDIEVVKCEFHDEIVDDKIIDQGLVDEDDDDDWEGIERTELERAFGAAVVYVGSVDNADKKASFGNDLKLQLYGLHKVATEGPCLVPQPMALKISARAKWNAWQQLGNMTPDAAMEQYIDLLSSNVPGWIDDVRRNGKQGFADTEASGKLAPEMFPCDKLGTLDERKSDEILPHVEGIDIGPNSSKKDN